MPVDGPRHHKQPGGDTQDDRRPAKHVHLHQGASLLRKFRKKPDLVQALAESLLATESIGLPVAVMRPSIVAASWKEPRWIFYAFFLHISLV